MLEGLFFFRLFTRRSKKKAYPRAKERSREHVASSHPLLCNHHRHSQGNPFSQQPRITVRPPYAVLFKAKQKLHNPEKSL